VLSRALVQGVTHGTGRAGVTAGTHARPVPTLRHQRTDPQNFLLATCRIRTRPFVEGV